ncbi:MAG: hypothetical protein ACPL1Y_06865 [Thermoplasmata archaeon]
MHIAKKVAITEKEEEAFQFPEFDEVEFVRKELKDTKGALAVVLLGIIFAVVSFIFTFIQQPGIGFLIGLAGMGSIKYLLSALKVDTSSYKIKNWLGHIGSYFFIWLAIWILLMNAPFSDFAKPTISEISVYSESGGNITRCEMKNYTGESKIIIKNTSSINFVIIQAKITDNSGLKSVRLIDKDGNQIEEPYVNQTLYQWKLLNTFRAGDTVFVFITAQDNSGNLERYAVELNFQ